MIHLITGTPGAGKTLRAMWHLEAAQKEGRLCFQDGVEGSAVPSLPGEDWTSVPDGSLVLIDEAQRVFPVRVKVESIPEKVRLLETHRHRGIDLVLTTQHPRLLDAHVRRLVGKHEHLRRVAGRPVAAVVEWVEVSEDLDSSKGASSVWPYPKKVYGQYKSASLHTKQGSVPKSVYVFVGVVVLGVAWVASSFQGWRKGFEGLQPSGVTGNPTGNNRATGGITGVSGAPGPAGGAAGPARYVPAVQGAAWSAPAYAEVEKVQAIPYPRGCIASATRCRCGTSQGTWLEVPDRLCRAIVAQGMFIPEDAGTSVSPGGREVKQRGGSDGVSTSGEANRGPISLPPVPGV